MHMYAEASARNRHPILRRIEDLADSPLIPALLEKVHTESDPSLLKASTPPRAVCIVANETDNANRLQYKAASKYREMLLPYLRELTASQIERGLVTYVSSLALQNCTL